jgi:hypothetical protein
LTQNGVVITDDTTTEETRWEDVVFHGDNFQDWRLRKARNESCTTDLSGTKMSVVKNDISYAQRGLKPPVSGTTLLIRGSLQSAHMSLLENPDTLSYSRAYNQAATQLLHAYQKATRARNLQTFVGELLETIRAIIALKRKLYELTVRYCLNVRKLWEDAKRLGTTWRDLRKKLATLYLSYQFAVKPINGELEALATLQARLESSGEARYVLIKGEGAESTPSGPIPGQPEVGYPGAAYATQKIARRSEAKVKFHGKVRIATSFDGFIQQGGLTIEDSLETIQELTPFSWALDYFSNVNDVLAQVAIGTRYDIAWLEVGIKRSSIVTGSVFTVKPHQDIEDGYYQVDCSGGAFVSQAVSVYRTNAGPSLPPVGLSFEIPSLGQLLNLGALGLGGDAADFKAFASGQGHDRWDGSIS